MNSGNNTSNMTNHLSYPQDSQTDKTWRIQNLSAKGEAARRQKARPAPRTQEKRELQRLTKQVEFIQQKTRRGVVDRSPLADLVWEKPDTKAFVIESAKRDANGKPISEARIETVENFAKACDGILEFNDKGEVIYKVCFAAGTLVHTDNGPLPIEQIRVGMQVLAQPEGGGERAYRSVLNTVAHLDQEVYAVQVKVAGADSLTTLFATGGHPFWVEAPLVDGAHWMATECLEPGFVLQLADGNKAAVHAAGLIRQTQFPEIGFAADERAGVGIVLDLSTRHAKLASDAVALKLGRLEVGEPWLTPVYNFEVEEFHTYYVGEVGVWAHNNEGCTPEKASEFVTRRADRNAERPTCFPMDTLVATKVEQWCEINLLGVGDWVLSRCETTGEQAYRRVTKKYEHSIISLDDSRIPLYKVLFITQNGREGRVDATAEHPFWVNGVGWVKARELQPGSMIEISDPIARNDVDRPDGLKSHDLRFSGQRWQAEVISVQESRGACTVYNIEVEDFHTYFVGGYGVWVHNKNQGEPAFTQELKLSNEAAKPQGQKYRPDIEKMEQQGASVERKDGAKGEIQAAEILAKYDNLQVAHLPDGEGANFLGRDGGRPDLLIDGRAADIYTPRKALPGEAVNVAQKLDTIWKTLEGKSKEQSPDVVLNLNQLEGELTGAQVLAKLAEKPIPSLGRVYILEPGKPPVIHDFPRTDSNIPIYGELYPQSGVTSKQLPKQPSKTVVYNQEVLAEGDAVGVEPIAFTDLQTLLPTARQYWLDAGASTTQLDGITLKVAPLAQRVAAMTVGKEISVSADGAGWGWFVDATPAEREEFGAGDTPTEFRASARSEAAGRLDLLTVLVHEMGHALGLNHVTGDDDLMAQFLEPGERRIPSLADRAALLQQAPGSGNAVGVLGTTYTRAAPAARPSQRGSYVLVTNPSLQNGDLDEALGWAAQGAVGFGASGARLGERADAQAALRQVFTVSDKDHYLRFTVAGDLHGQSDGPSDAFEAALLDANTGAALRAISGLSHSDALLNIQGSKTSGVSFGQSRNASGVAVRENADGSRTYTVDLAGIPAQTAVELSFDLIGFGEADSAMLVSDVKLLSDLPPESALQPYADVVTTAEDTPVTIEVKANDRVPTGAIVEVALAAAPQHGSVTLNADGSFAYTPEANWFGNDSFTYTLKAGNEVSEAARVSLSVTPVNDAPVLANSSLATPMGSPLAIKLSETAQDVAVYDLASRRNLVVPADYFAPRRHDTTRQVVTSNLR